MEVISGAARARLFPPRLNEGLELRVLDGPPSDCIVQGRPYLHRAGVVAVMWPGLVWSARTRAPFLSLEIAPQRLNEALKGLLKTPHLLQLRCFLHDDPRLRRRFVALHRLFAEGGTAVERPRALQQLIELLVERCVGEIAPVEREGNAPVHRARALLHEAFDENITLERLVNACGASSRFKLLRDFRHSFGLTPHDYLVQLRLSRARARIRRGHPLSEVAIELGFFDQAHLTRHFSRTFGVTPKVYRGLG